MNSVGAEFTYTTQPGTLLLPFRRDRVRPLYSPKEWAEVHSHLRWKHRGKPRNDDWADWFAVVNHLERRFGDAQGQNLAWFQANEEFLRNQHPEWIGKFVAISSGIDDDDKVLAVEDNRDLAIRAALETPSLNDLAQKLDLPASILLTLIFFADP